MAGKGDRYRPVNGDRFRANWDRVFGKRGRKAAVKKRGKDGRVRTDL